jgi:hypothetical protein
MLTGAEKIGVGFVFLITYIVGALAVRFEHK